MKVTNDSILKSKDSDIKKASSAHFKSAREFEKVITNLKEDLEKAITDKNSALADKAFEITNAVNEAKIAERHHFNDLFNKEKAKVTKMKATGDAKMQKINVSRYRQGGPFSMQLNAHSSCILYPFSRLD